MTTLAEIAPTFVETGHRISVVTVDRDGRDPVRLSTFQLAAPPTVMSWMR